MPNYTKALTNINSYGSTKNYIESRISGAASGYAFVVSDGSTNTTINSTSNDTVNGTETAGTSSCVYNTEKRRDKTSPWYE